MALTSVANVSAFLQQTIDGTTTPSDTTVTEWIAEVSDEIEHITKQKFEINTVTDLIIGINSDTTTTSANSFDGTAFWEIPSGRDQVVLPQENILTLTKVEVNTVADSITPVWEELTIGYGGDVILTGNKLDFIGYNFRYCSNT